MVRRAFTLIELLVVIAIIAILAAILFPVFAQAKLQAKLTTCASNQKQISLATLMYATDFDEAIPLAFVPERPAPGQFDPVLGVLSWHNLVQPYQKNWGVNICPDYPPFNKASTDWKDPFISFAIPPSSRVSGREFWRDGYYQNRRVRWDGLTGAYRDSRWMNQRGSDTPSRRTTQIADAGSMTMLTDSTSPDWWLIYSAGNAAIADNTFAYYISRWYPQYGSQTFGPLARHRMKRRNYISYREDVGQINVSFVDGHTKTFNLFQYLRVARAEDGTEVYANLWPHGL
jgi:prepilin-type N-terminal cleavage/methylation domain-containing protein/prepilin-type processing-associated H-X9-DG protein